VSDARTRKDREHIIQNYMEQFSVVKRSLLDDEEVRQKYESDERFLTIFKAYQDALLESGGIDFDDILVYAHKILLTQPWCGDVYRAKFKHVLVDEAQDLNRAQYEFVKALCSDKIKSLMMVGDPNQMIYGFNGSSHEYLCQHFLTDFSPQKFELKENYRSTKAVIYLANKLKPGSQIEAEFALDGHSQIEEMRDEESEAYWIIDTIKILVGSKGHHEIEGEISLNKIVVIARNRFAFGSLQEKLKLNDIPYSLKQGERQIEPSSLFGRILDLSIRLRLNPKDWVDGKKLCAILKIDAPEVWGGADLLTELSEQVKTSSVEFPELISSLLLSIQDMDIDEPKIPKFCAKFKTDISALALKSNEEDELALSLQELKDFRSSWNTFKRKGLGHNLLSFRNSMALGQLAEDFNPDGLTLSTVHTMKGLEKDIVFLIGMCEGVFPDYRAQSKPALEEERNSAFVAVTRSKRWIYITYPLLRQMPWGKSKVQEKSRFITEMESN
jgi:DNA helicase-2/ATP-dependent DNA helicase PcrA